jgi:tetratricopeptide (TPR) repeat protein
MGRGLGFVLLFALASPAGAAPDPAARDLRTAINQSDRGMAVLAKGNTTKAREAFEKALALVPDLPQAHLGLGHVAMQEKRFDVALTEFKAAEAGFVTMSSVTLQLEADRYARSRDELQRLRTELTQLDNQARQNQVQDVADSQTPTGLSGGQIERERAQYQSRIQALEAMNPPSAGTVRPAPAEVFFFEGNALFNLKRTPEAIAAWEEALKRDAKQPLAENNLAVAYWMTGRLNEARAAVQRAERLGFRVNPNFRADLEKATGEPQ